MRARSPASPAGVSCPAVALRELGIATVVGFAGATAWYLYIKENSLNWAAVNKVRAPAWTGARRIAGPERRHSPPRFSSFPPQAYQVKKVEKRKAYEAWLKAQPFDDEVA